ncbi:MAG: molybdopterin-dependent oxidoreductase [Thermodesulfobacteriota bacterium]
METITLTINGKTISARAGRTVLEVARRHGIYIPTLCHHEALRPIGACRLCQVEDEKRGVVVPACVTKVAQGMVITTDSERVIRNRRNLIRLLLAAHPESCVVCEKGNTCQLRKLAARMGVGAHGLDRMPYHPAVQDLNPFMSRDLSKCIMCAKCVRADQEVVCEGVIDYNYRGFDAHPATLFSRPLETAQCTFCGSCLNVCPVGAIAEKNKKRLDHAGSRTRSVCSFCACGCSIYLEHDRSLVRGVAPTEDDFSANGITLCVKGHFGHDYLANPDRLASPLVRTTEGFRPASWDEALDLIAQNLGRIGEEDGPEALAFLGGARGTNEEDYLFQKLARSVFGTNNVDFSFRSKWSEVFGVLRESTGFAAGSSSLADVEGSGAILIVGADPTRSAPVLGYHIKRAARRGAGLIVIDPVRTRLAALAKFWLRPRPAADFHLLSGFIKVILEEGLADLQFITANTKGFEGLQVRFENVLVSDCARKAGVAEEKLREAARFFAQSQTGFVVFGQGLVGQEGAADLVRLVVDLVLLTGNLAKDRRGLLPVLKDCNAQGALDMGVCPHWLPGQKDLADPAARERLARFWGAPPPERPGLEAAAMPAAAAAGGLKAMWVFGENPAAIWPGGAEALSKLSFLVVQDLFLTETARLAHVVLPSAAWAEKGGTATNLERRVQRLHRAVLTPGGFPADLEVFCALAARRGRKWEYDSPDEVLAEIEQGVPLYADVSQAGLDQQAVFWPQPGLEEVVDTLPHGIGHEDGKALLLAPGPDGRPALAPEADWLFVLMQGSVLQHLGAGSRTGRSKRLRLAGPGPALCLCPADLESLGLGHGDRVRVVSPDGSVETEVRAEEGLPAGLVFLPAAFAEVRPADLFPAGAGKVKHCRVRIEKVTA